MRKIVVLLIVASVLVACGNKESSRKVFVTATPDIGVATSNQVTNLTPSPVVVPQITPTSFVPTQVPTATTFVPVATATLDVPVVNQLGCQSAFHAGQQVTPNPKVDDGLVVYFADHVSTRDAWFTVQYSQYYDDPYLDSLILLIDQVGCENGVPIWLVEVRNNGLRGWILESVNGLVTVAQAPDISDYVALDDIGISFLSYCRQSIGGNVINEVNGQWECFLGGDGHLNSLGIINLEAACEYVYGTTRDGRDVIYPVPYLRVVGNFQTWDCRPDSLAKANNGGVIEGYLSVDGIGTYLFVPSPVAPGTIEAYAAPDDRGPVLGTLSNLHYYIPAGASDDGKWIRIFTATGSCWVKADELVSFVTANPNSLPLFTQTGDLYQENFEQLMRNVYAADFYSDVAQFLRQQNELSIYQTEELDRWLEALADNVDYMVSTFNFVSNSAAVNNTIKFVCAYAKDDLMINGEQLTANQSDAICLVADVATEGLTSGVFVAPLSLMAINNFGDFIRWNDTVWMNRFNLFMACGPITSFSFCIKILFPADQ